MLPKSKCCNLNYKFLNLVAKHSEISEVASFIALYATHTSELKFVFVNIMT